MFLSLARTRPSTPVFGSFSDNHIPRKHVSECTSDPAVQFSKSSSKIYSNLIGKSQPNCRVQNSFEPGKSTKRGAFGPPALLISDRPSRLWRCCAGNSISWGRSDAITSAAGRRRGRITPRHGTRERSKVGFEGEGSSERRTPSVGTSRSLSPGKLRGRHPWRYGDSLLLYDYIHYDVDE